jgi:hypothetical protein
LADGWATGALVTFATEVAETEDEDDEDDEDDDGDGSGTVAAR